MLPVQIISLIFLYEVRGLQIQLQLTRVSIMDSLLPAEVSIGRSTGRSVVHCNVQCSAVRYCVSVSYYQNTCHFHSTSVFNTSTPTIVAAGARTYSLTTEKATTADGYTCVRRLNWCYRFSDGVLNWTESRESCQEDGGDLLVIDSQEKHDIIQEVLHTKGGHIYYLGMNDIQSEGEFVDLEGNPLVYTNWNVEVGVAPQPNDFNSNQDCVGLRVGSAGWYDEFCHLKTGYVCGKTFCW